MSLRHASLRAVTDSESDATAGDGGSSSADGGDLDRAGRCGEEPGEPWGETAALQDNQTQSETRPRGLLSGGLPRSARYTHGLTGPPAPRRGRGEALRPEEGRPGYSQELLRPRALTECKE